MQDFCRITDPQLSFHDDDDDALCLYSHMCMLYIDLNRLYFMDQMNICVCYVCGGIINIKIKRDYFYIRIYIYMVHML